MSRSVRRPPHVFARLAFGLVALSLVASAAGVPADARKPVTGFADPLYQSGDGAERDRWLTRTKRAGSEIVRLEVSWTGVTSGRPVAPRNPVDPAYQFGALDAAVGDARSKGLRVLLTVAKAPSFAEGANRPASAPPGTWKPNPDDLGDFAHALAQRYSGDTLGLPRVRYFQAWNEPNLSTYLTPQYSGRKNKSASHYKRMLNAFYRGVSSAQRKAQILTGGTAPYGDPPGGDRTRPLTFLRKMFCLKGGQRRLRPAKCRNKPLLDVLAHHPINTSGGPRRSAVNPNDASTPDFDQIRRIMRAAERGRNVGTGGRHPLWATEIWWDTDPPSRNGVKPRTQARWLEQALRILSRDGAQVVLNLRIRDARTQNHTALRASASGIYAASGKAKPALRKWRNGSR